MATNANTLHLRFEDLASLAPGWRDGDGEPIDTAALQWGRDFVDLHVPADLYQTLKLFPTLDGGLLLESQASGRRWTLEIEPGGDNSVLVVPTPVTGTEFIADMSENLDGAAAAASLIVFHTEAEAIDASYLHSLAVIAARLAGDELLARYNRPIQGLETKHDENDYVSDADRAAETALVDFIKRERPHDGIVSEEGASAASESGLRWVLDPLDGTANYVAHLPQWCVSVGVTDAEGNGIVGVVHDPLHDETWSAQAGGPLLLNGEAFDRPVARPPARGFVCVCAGRRSNAEHPRQGWISQTAVPAFGHTRQINSAALDLAWAAAGRYDAMYHELGTSEWDVAGGLVLCKAAGLEIRHLPPIDAGLNPRLLVFPTSWGSELLELLAPDEPDYAAKLHSARS